MPSPRARRDSWGRCVWTKTHLEFAKCECYIRSVNEIGTPIRDVDHLRDALALLGALLAAEGETARIAVVGGSAMLLDGLIARATRDVDVVALVEGDELVGVSESSAGLNRYVSAVALELGLEPHWLNFGPTSLLDAGLPTGFLRRCRAETFGALTVFIADRYDLIHMKLYAATDHGPTSKHMADLEAMKPSPQELEDARRWCMEHDVSDAFANELDSAIAWVDGRRDG